MKRKLSLLMALMMVVALLPMSSFAATKTSVATQTVGADSKFNVQFQIENDGAFGMTTGGIFELVLGDNASWTSGQTLPDYVVRRTSKVLEITATGGTITLNPEIELSGASGEQKVQVRNINANVTNQTITYAIVEGTGDIVVRALEGKKTINRSSTATGAAFEIREVTANAISTDQVVTLRLPAGFTWDAATRWDGNTGTVNGRNFTFTMPATGSIQRVIVTPVIRADRDARFGNVDVEVSSRDIRREFVTVAECADFGVTVKVDKVREIIAGRTEEGRDYDSKITLEPVGQNSFIQNREIEVTFSNRIKLSDIKFTNTVGNTYVDSNVNSSGNASKVYIKVDDVNKDVVIEPVLFAGWDRGGEVLEVTVEGAGVEKQTVKLADILAPAKVETTVTTVNVGSVAQQVAEIKITETVAGSLAEGKYSIDFGADGISGLTFSTEGNYTVVGDIDVDDYDRNSDRTRLILDIKGKSREASTITLSGIKVNVDRTVATGDFNARLARFTPEETVKEVIQLSGGGTREVTRVVASEGFNKIVEFPYLRVGQVGDFQRLTTVFTLDSTTYTVDGVEMTLDAAPYISNNRTMLPIGTVARVLGATVNYSPATRTAVFTRNDLVVSMNLDTNVLLVNGSPVMMDANPEIVNSRAFVPVVFVAQAFGVQNNTEIVYDAATRTITMFPNN